MKKEEVKKIIKYMRKRQNELNKGGGYPYYYVSTNLESTEGYLMDINPFRVDLRTGYYFGREERTGKYKKVKLW